MPGRPCTAQYIELTPVDRLACHETRRITIRARLAGGESGPSLAVARHGQPLLTLAYPSPLEVSLRAVFAAPRSATVTDESGRACADQAAPDDGTEPMFPYESAVQADLDCRLAPWLVHFR